MIFEFDNDYNIIIDAKSVALKPFAAIKKKYKNKKLFIEEMVFIAYFTSPKSDFYGIRDRELRKKTILRSLAEGSKLKLDKVTDSAIEFAESEFLKSVKVKYLSAALDALDKTRGYLSDVDYSIEVKGKPVYDPKKIIDILKDAPKLMSSIKELEEQIAKDEEQEGEVRGAHKKGIYED